MSRRTRFAINSGRGMVFAAGGQSLHVDFIHNTDGTMSVCLGAPYDAIVQITRQAGRRKLVFEAPEGTSITKEPPR